MKLVKAAIVNEIRRRGGRRENFLFPKQIILIQDIH
jgi:hypothetical protein